MLHDEYKYVGYKSDLYQPTAIVPIGSAEAAHDKEHYQTIYRFNDVVLSYSSLASLKPDITFYSDYLAFDIDREELDEAIKDTIFLERFLSENEIGFETWFSGAKGFHVMIPTVQFGFQPTNNSEILRLMALTIAQGVGITIDSKIYNATRVFRMAGSLNKKTGDYKRKCTFTSVNPDGPWEVNFDGSWDYPEPWDYVQNDALLSLYQNVLKEIESEKDVKVSGPKAITRLFEEVSQGDRNDTCYRISKTLRGFNIPQEAALPVLEWWNANKVFPPLEDAEVKRTINSAYRGDIGFTIADPSMESDHYDVERSVNQILTDYKDFDRKVVKIGYDFFDEYTMGLMPGDLTFWIAVNGNLKTCILSNILHRIAKRINKHAIFFSMDMSADAISMRHMQMAEKLTLKEVYGHIRKGYHFSEFKKEFKNVHVIGKKGPSIQDVSHFLNWFTDHRGEVGAIGFDYLGAFKGCDNDHKVTGETVHGLSELAAKVAGCPSFCLVQARREYEGRGGNVEIDKTAGKDTSAIEHKGDFIIGNWWYEGQRQTFEGKPIGEPQRIYYGRFLKNRKFDSEKYPDNAYFSMEFDKQHMLLNSMKFENSHPTFPQKMRYQNG